jgi:hypothetical protein
LKKEQQIMKRYYICPKEVWAAHIHLMDGSDYVEMDDHVLVSTDFRSHLAESKWHEHPEVARLAHPHHEQHLPIGDLHTEDKHKHKQFKHHHFKLLEKHFQIEHHHTVIDLHHRLKTDYPAMKLIIY